MSLAGFIAAQRTEHGVPHAVSCRALGTSQAWFYKWRGGDASLRRERRRALAALAAELFKAHHGAYGSPRITADLRDLGWAVSKNTVAKVMAEQRLAARAKRKRGGLTKQDAAGRKAPDLLRRDFSPPAQPDVRWVGDLTEIPNDEGKLCLASVEDLHSRRIVGFALGERHDAELAKAALCVAIAIRGGEVAGVVFHSDQGGEHTGGLFAAACARAGARQSMGRTGSALDNAAAESLFSTLQFELLANRHFTTRAQAPPGSRGLDRGVQPDQEALHQRDARPGRLRAGPRRHPRTGSVSSARPPGPRAGGNGGGFAAAVIPKPDRGLRVRRAGYGAAPPASMVANAIAARRPAAAIDPGATAAPPGRSNGQAGPARAQRARTRKPRSASKITTPEVSTVTGDCQPRTRVLRRSAQPDPPPRVLERPPPRPTTNQPPRPARN
jgi:putative transposase